MAVFVNNSMCSTLFDNGELLLGPSASLAKRRVAVVGLIT